MNIKHSFIGMRYSNLHQRFAKEEIIPLADVEPDLAQPTQNTGTEAIVSSANVATGFSASALNSHK